MFKLSEICSIIENRIKNKKDMIFAITGDRGDGKSTFAYKIAHKTKLKFKPHKDIAYSIKEVLDWYSKNEKRILIFDEAIAVHNRSFLEKNQRKLIQILNMYRDSCNVLLLCVPNFSNIDTQLRQLVRMRVHIYERGRGVIHIPSRGTYTRDRWDFDINSKMEMDCLKKNKRISFYRSTTFFGYVKFGALPPDQEKVYNEIKKKKRNVVYDDINEKKEKNVYDLITDQVCKGMINKDGIVQFARVYGVREHTVREIIRKRLRERGETKPLRELLVAPTM